MRRSQFSILYRLFLFQLVDRDLLAAQAQGDPAKLLGRIASVLVFLSVGFTMMLMGIGGNGGSREAVLASGWLPEHLLFATTMLFVGIFAVLTWDTTFPDRRDVLVLGPLPVRSGTIFLAKVASTAAALSGIVFALNGLPGLLLPTALAPPGRNLIDFLLTFDLYRTLAAYWITAFLAGTFMLCSLLTLQGIAAQLPRPIFLRASAVLQIGVLCLAIGVYFLQPSLATPEALTRPENKKLLAWLPSYWFLGLFQVLAGTTAGTARGVLNHLADRAWIGLAGAVTGTGTAFLLAYYRMIRKIVEAPDLVPGARHRGWLPPFGNSLDTAIVQFSVRSLLRSRQHRLILAFYLGLGFGIMIPFLQTPVAIQLASVSGLASSFVLMCFWMLAVRSALSIPVELRANWIFRTTVLRPEISYLAANRKVLWTLAFTPFWTVCAAILLSLWPWQQATEHLAVLALILFTFVELSLYNLQKVPFACSYLPGKSNLHITFCLSLMGGLAVTFWMAEMERRAMADVRRSGWMFAVLLAVCVIAWWRTRIHSRIMPLRFEEALPPEVMTLGLHRDGETPMEVSPS